MVFKIKSAILTTLLVVNGEFQGVLFNNHILWLPIAVLA